MGDASPRRGGLAPALVALLVLFTASACGGGGDVVAQKPAPSISAVPTDPEVAATGLPEGVDVEVIDSAAGTENGDNLDFVSPVYSVEPVGPLDELATVTVRLDNALPDGTPLLVATRELETDPWTYQTGTLTSDKRHVEFRTRTLDHMGVLAIDLSGLLAGFKSDLHEALAPRKRGKIAEPTCLYTGDALSEGYAAKASKNTTLFWCLGLRNDKRVLMVTNRRQFPVQVSHPDMDVVEAPGFVAAYATWAKVLGGKDTLLAPGRTVTYDAELEPTTRAQVVAATSVEAQSLRIFLAGTRALVARMHAFGIPSVTVQAAVKKLMDTPWCRRSLSQGVDSVVAHCFTRARLAKLFGSRATMLAPLLESTSFPALFTSRGKALKARAAAQRQRIVVRRAKPNFSALVGLWSGKTRLLATNGEGLVTEKVYDAAGKLKIQLTYQLGYPVTQDGVTSADTTVTAVKANPKLLKGKAPKVGATGSISVKAGVIKAPYLNVNYCDAKASKKKTCG